MNILNTLQARHDAKQPVSPSTNEELHEDICQELDRTKLLLHALTKRINAVHELAEGSRFDFDADLSNLMYQFDTDEALQNVNNFLNGDV